jgi:hypothetical protein
MFDPTFPEAVSIQSPKMLFAHDGAGFGGAEQIDRDVSGVGLSCPAGRSIPDRHVLSSASVPRNE